MYRATGHVNTHKGMIFTLGIFSAAAGRCIREDGTVTLQSILRMEQKMTARILRAEIEMLGKEPAKSNGEKKSRTIRDNRDSRGSTCRIPICFSYCASGTGGWTFCGEWSGTDQIRPFCTNEPVQDSNILSRKNPSVLYQVRMEAMQFLEEGGAYSEDALDKLIRMDADYIKRGISCGWVCRSSCHLTVSCDAVQ